MNIRYLSLLLILAGIWFLPTAGLAQSDADRLSLSYSTQPVRVGDTITITVEGKGLQGLYANEVRIAYEPESLQYVGTELRLNGGFPVFQNTGNEIILAHTFIGAKAGLTGDHELYRLKLKVLQERQTHVRLTKSIKVKLANGTSVGEEDLRVSDITVGTGTAEEDKGNGNENGNGNGNGKDHSTGGTQGELPIDSHSVTPHRIVTDGSADSQGRVKVQVDPEKLRQAMESSAQSEVVVEVRQSQGTRSIQVQLPLNSLGGDNKWRLSLRVETGLASVTIPSKLWGELQRNQPGHMELGIEVLTASDIPLGFSERMRDGDALIDLTLLADGRRLHDFAGAEVKVELPYQGKHAWQPHRLVVYYVSDNGTLEVVKNSRYNQATSRMETTLKHFSKYYVSYNDKPLFDDLNQAEWGRSAIEALALQSTIQGVSEREFQPQSYVTRAQFIKMVIDAFDLMDTSAISRFEDVLPGEWYYPAIASAEELGIVEGNSQLRFGVKEFITRQEMAAIIYRAMQCKGIVSKQDGTVSAFTDLDHISSYAVKALTSLHASGIIQGMENGKLEPGSYATRAQAAVILYRIPFHEHS
ncbi:S-layer homology domain-containing protein [Paenibacillus roseipurpureus]|uniref:S-layer homology domain-containing protein n=1 Tax=Paenibacillus roseopurpureus TaxID=2918901 RepID=A0AA96LL81_9BACL|nr:S-layer homology domain-containing protein [Paenibacillus sp. MBLB1832]WNR43043.1 S-layer homology domain-containing protein [Paenibacillus sp. MBLB1832]